MDSIDRRSDAVAPFARQVLGDAELLVAEPPREELAASGGCHRRHHAQLLLPSEIRMEEFRHRHAEPALHKLGDRGNCICNGSIGTIEVDLRARQTADYTIAVGAKLEIELDLDLSARSGADEPDGVAVAANRPIPIKGPRDCLENQGFAGTGWTDDAGETRSEIELG